MLLQRPSLAVPMARITADRLVRHLADRAIPLEICITSNVMTIDSRYSGKLMPSRPTV